jgi:hypothetical protein
MTPTWKMPDGSRWAIPDWTPVAPPCRVAASPMQWHTSPDVVRQFLREIGRRGGKARAAQHSRDEIAAWRRVRHKNAAKL